MVFSREGAALVVFLAACGVVVAGTDQALRSAKGQCYPQASHPAGTMRALWLTPVYTASLGGASIDDAVHNSITERALQLYSRYEQWPERAALLRDGVADTDAFFRWQQSFGGFDEVTAELQLLKEAFVHSCVAFGRSLGWQGVESRWHADDVQVWVGVMGAGAYHPPHVHKGAVLSGAYYVNAPPGSGDIVFHDPRGALPPFEHTLRYAAQVGHMVVFPSWLVHEVLPNALAGEWATPTTKRVAVSFNLRGQWEDTSDVSVAFPA